MDHIRSDRTYTGTQRFSGPVILPGACVGDTNADPVHPLDDDKVKHRHIAFYGQSGSATTVTLPLHCAFLAGEVLDVAAGSIAACVGDSTVTIDVLKNGTTILDEVIELDSTSTAYTSVFGVIADDQEVLAADDILTLAVTATIGTGTLATGLYVSVAVKENAA
jgi:hypothetical protein